jgi:type IV pilus assembly protein PilQ
MDEKKNSGLAVIVKKSIGIYHPVVFIAVRVVLLAAAVSPWSPAEAASRKRTEIPPGLTMSSKDASIYPILAAINVSQMGGNMLRIRFRGFELPIPRAASAPGEAKLVLQWDGARFPQITDKKDWWSDYDWDVMLDLLSVDGKTTNSWWKQYDMPLLNRVNAEPIDEDSVRLTFTTSQPVVIERVEGIAGADELTVVLKTYEPDKPPVPAEKPRQYEKGDPMGIKSPVTLQLRDAEIKSVFRMLADMQKLNLLLDPSVPDMTVTFSFNAVPYSEAFSYLLRMADLSYSVQSGMLVVGRPESIGKTLGTEITRAYKLSYAVDEAGQLRGDLTGTLTELVSLSKSPAIDARNREIYITATEEQHKEVAAVLEKLDHPGKQVMLEAKIFEVTDNGRQDLQTLVTGVYDSWIASFTDSGLSLGYNYSNRGFENGDDWSLPIGGSLGGSPVYENPIINGAERTLMAGLRALEEKRKGKTLANPSIIALDGQAATVDLRQNLKYVSGVDSNGNIQWGDAPSGPLITFTPIVGRDGIVTINIQVETGTMTLVAAGMGAQAPQTTSRKVQTMVRVRNGEPFVVGGLYEDAKSNSKVRIPVLGYIPLLGDLFKYNNTTHNKSEVAIIVIPYILDIPDNKIDTFDLKKMSNLN